MKAADLTQPQRDLLERLYELSSRGNGTEMLALDEWASETATPWPDVERFYNDCRDKGWIESPVVSWHVRLTENGVVECERVGCAPAGAAAENNRIRERILLLLAERGGEGQRANQEELANVASCSVEAADRNALLMSRFGLLTAPVAGWFGATNAGLAEAARFKRARARVEHFVELKDGTTFTPQERGHEIEKLIEEAARADGWESDRQVRGKGEEQDLVLHREREYFLVESKWLSGAVEAGVVREFAGRVEGRAGVHGLAMSMSGFSLSAVDWALMKLSTCMILLFGPQDIESLVTGKRNFTSLLDEKVHAVVARREVLWR